MSKQQTNRPSSTNSLVILLDGLCIRCDKEHDKGHCYMTEEEWRQSDRFSNLRGLGIEAIIYFVRKDRAGRVLGGRANV